MEEKLLTEYHVLQRKNAELEEDVSRWKSYQKEYEKLRLFLEDLPKTTRRPYMVPFSKKGFIPGFLVHTNEILVLLGENWFIERSSFQAIDIINRRLEYVKSHLETLDLQQKNLKTQLDSVIKNHGKIYNEEGLPIVEIREELNEDGTIASSEVLDNLMEPWIMEASEEFVKKYNTSLGMTNEDHYGMSDINENFGNILDNTTRRMKNDDIKSYVPSDYQALENVETLIDVVNEIDEANNDADEKYSYSDSSDNEEVEDEYGRTRGFISPVGIRKSSLNNSKNVKKVTFSESIISEKEDHFDTQNIEIPKEQSKKVSNSIIKDVIERPSTQSIEYISEEFLSSSHWQEISSEYCKLKDKLHSQSKHFDDDSFEKRYIEDKNLPKKKISRFMATFMDKEI